MADIKGFSMEEDTVDEPLINVNVGAGSTELVTKRCSTEGCHFGASEMCGDCSKIMCPNHLILGQRTVHRKQKDKLRCISCDAKIKARIADERDRKSRGCTIV